MLVVYLEILFAIEWERSWSFFSVLYPAGDLPVCPQMAINEKWCNEVAFTFSLYILCMQVWPGCLSWALSGTQKEVSYPVNDEQIFINWISRQ